MNAPCHTDKRNLITICIVIWRRNGDFIMKRIISILICIVIFSCARIPACAKGEYDIKVTKIDESIADIYPLFDGMHRFKAQNGRYGFLDENYEIAIEPIYEYAYDFKAQSARVRLNGNMGLIDTNGNVIIPMEYRSISNFDDDGIAVITDKASMRGFVNSKGKFLSDIKYPRLTAFNGNYAMANTAEEYSYTLLIDKNFKEKELKKYPYILDIWDNGNIVVRNKNDKVGVIDTKFRVVVPFIYENINSHDTVGVSDTSHGGPYKVVKNKKMGYIDKNGEIILPIIYDYVGEYMPNGATEVSINGEKYLVSDYDKLIKAEHMHKNIYKSQSDDGGVIYINSEDGTRVGENDIVLASEYVNGVALAVKNAEVETYFGKHMEPCYGLVNESGEIIRNFDIETVKYYGQSAFANESGSICPYAISDSLIAVNSDYKWGYINLSGEVVIEPVWRQATDFRHGYARVQDGDDWVTIDKDGKIYENLYIIEGNSKYSSYYSVRNKCEDISFYLFEKVYNRVNEYIDYSRFNNYYLLLNEGYGALMEDDTIIFESKGDKLLDFNGNILTENCIINSYANGEKQISLSFTADKNVVAETTDGKYVIEIKGTDAR